MSATGERVFPPCPLDETLALEELVESAAGLVSPPSVCTKVLALARDPNASASHFAEVIALDPNLAARVLRLVNSAYYGFRGQIDNLAMAVMVLGIRDLANVALAVSVVRSFSKLKGGLVGIDDFWRHGIFVAMAARRLARELGLEQPERLFVAGLLHDVGSPLIYNGRPELTLWMREVTACDEQRVDNEERQYLRFTHADVGGSLLEAWELPESLRQAIAEHHTVPDSGAALSEGSVLYLADRLAQSSEAGALGEPARGLDETAGEVVALLAGAVDEDGLRRLVEDVTAEMAESTRALTG